MCIPDKYVKCLPVERDTNLGSGPVEDGVREDFLLVHYMGIHINILPVQKIK